MSDISQPVKVCLCKHAESAHNKKGCKAKIMFEGEMGYCPCRGFLPSIKDICANLTDGEMNTILED